MADNNVFVLFEEIKTALNDINNKLEDLPKSVAQAPQNTTNAQDTSPIKEVAKTEHFHPLERFNPFTFEPNIGLKLA